jgi:hypothetical protein
MSYTDFVNMLSKHFPVEGQPLTIARHAGKRSHWLLNDNEALYNAKPASRYGPKDIVYQFNALGCPTDVFMQLSDFARDGQHPGPDTCQEYAAQIAPKIAARIKLKRASEIYAIPLSEERQEECLQALRNLDLGDSEEDQILREALLAQKAMPAPDLPATNMKGRAVSAWLGVDNLESYQNRSPSGYNSTDIEYCFNSHSYRCREFDDRGDINILLLGGSESLGIGVAEEQTYAARLEASLNERHDKSVRVRNLGMTVCSNDTIARLSMLAIPYFEPDAVHVTWCPPSRREFFLSDGDSFIFNPNHHNKVDPLDLPENIRGVVSGFRTIANDPQDYFNILLNYFQAFLPQNPATRIIPAAWLIFPIATLCEAT